MHHGPFGINELYWGRNAGERRHFWCGELQDFATASSYQVRDELAGLIERDLLGP
jgi:hypothetical protein